VEDEWLIRERSDSWSVYLLYIHRRPTSPPRYPPPHASPLVIVPGVTGHTRVEAVDMTAPEDISFDKRSVQFRPRKF
jgi:hypothetical protein